MTFLFTVGIVAKILSLFRIHKNKCRWHIIVANMISITNPM